MTVGNCITFILLGVSMALVPDYVPDCFPSGALGDNTSALWLEAMGVVQAAIGSCGVAIRLVITAQKVVVAGKEPVTARWRSIIALPNGEHARAARAMREGATAPATSIPLACEALVSSAHALAANVVTLGQRYQSTFRQVDVSDDLAVNLAEMNLTDAPGSPATAAVGAP